MGFVLHSAWRATAPYRVRIGLALKGVAYDYAAVDLLKGEQREPAYRAVNPQGLTPASSSFSQSERSSACGRINS